MERHRGRPVGLLAIAGIIGPIWFIALVIAQGMLQPDYSHIALPISALAAWPLGWMQRLNFFVFGTLMAVFTVALHKTIRPTRHGLAGIVLLLVSCTGICLAGPVAWRSTRAGRTSPRTCSGPASPC